MLTQLSPAPSIDNLLMKDDEIFPLTIKIKSYKENCVKYATNTELNCSSVFNGTLKLDDRKRKSIKTPSDSEFYHLATSCEWIRKNMKTGYYVSEEEKQFPLAFALNVYESPYQIFRFLKVIYRPHNLYCIHFDKKSNELFKKLIVNISTCLPNVIVPNKIEDVVWGWHTIVDAQMNCLNDLYELQTRFPWKYVITLCGKEVPLRTNREIVNTLRKLNETSAVELIDQNKFDYVRYVFKHFLFYNFVLQSPIKMGPIPFNLNISKSMAYFGLSRKFVSFLLHNEMAKIFRAFMDNTKIMDEHFIATLYNTSGMSYS